MKHFVCKRLAACLCMKQPPRTPLEPPLIRKNKQSVSVSDCCSICSVHDNDTMPCSHTTENDTVQKLLKIICNLMENRVHSKEQQRYEVDKENEMKKDWILAAAVLDRICAIAFAVIFIGGTLVFLVLFSTQ